MKRQVRKKVFETNSSSTHAICVSNKPFDYSDLPRKVYFYHGEFGWEVDKRYDTASYLYQAICNLYWKDLEARMKVLHKISDIMSKYNIECVFEKPDLDEGYVDHYDELDAFVENILNDEDLLIRYLFGDSFIVTGNDNSEEFDETMYDNDGKIKTEFSNYEVYEKGN